MARRAKGDTTTRDKILLTAKKLFAVKGYDATSVDLIVEKSNVNKSSVYYYFKSKRSILEEIYREFMTEANNLKKKFAAEQDVSHNGLLESLELNARYSDVVRIMWMESLKDTSDEPVFMQFFDQSFIDGQKIAEEAGLSLQDTPKNRIMVIFMATLPIWGFTALGENIRKYYGWEEEDFTKDFIEVFSEVYVKSLERVLLSKNQPE